MENDREVRLSGKVTLVDHVVDYDVDDEAEEEARNDYLKGLLAGLAEHGDDEELKMHANLRKQKPEMVKDLEETIHDARGQLLKSGHVIRPDEKRMQYWDAVSLSALTFTAIVTPVEVVFLPPALDALFVVNQLVSVVFIVDVYLGFHTAYKESSTHGGHWVIDKEKIASHYLRTWFLIDLISIIPFDIISMLEVGTGAGVQRLKVIRVIRLLRLLKLARILGASRIVQRWECQVSINHGLVALSKFGLVTTMCCHWMACLWGAVGTLAALGDGTGESDSWMAAGGYLDLPPGELYTISLYWSIVTVTSIGYGDITPVSHAEHLTCIACMLMGSTIWAYNIGNACSVLSTMNIVDIEFRQTLDNLNFFMDDKRLPSEMRHQIRAYFHATKHLQRSNMYSELIAQMSPMLQGEVAMSCNEAWLRQVWYFNLVPEEGEQLDWLVEHHDFIVTIALRIEHHMYAPQEMMAGTHLHIVEKGIAALHGCIRAKGGVWGEDMIVSKPRLRNHYAVRALSYVEVLCLTRHQLDDILVNFPLMALKVRRAAAKIAFKTVVRRIVRYLRKEKARKEAHARQHKQGTAFQRLQRITVILPEDRLQRFSVLAPQAPDPSGGGPQGPETAEAGSFKLRPRQPRVSLRERASITGSMEHRMELGMSKHHGARDQHLALDDKLEQIKLAVSAPTASQVPGSGSAADDGDAGGLTMMVDKLLQQQSQVLAGMSDLQQNVQNLDAAQHRMEHRLVSLSHDMSTLRAEWGGHPPKADQVHFADAVSSSSLSGALSARCPKSSSSWGWNGGSQYGICYLYKMQFYFE